MTKEELWSARIARFEQTGGTLKAFAAQEGVNASTLEWWRRRLRGQRVVGKAPTPTPRFVEVQLAEVEPVVSSGFVVQLAVSGHRIEVPGDFDARALRRLMGALC